MCEVEPFPLVPRNVEAAELAVRVSEMFVEDVRGGKPGLISTCPDVLKQRGSVIEIIEGLFVGHNQLK